MAETGVPDSYRSQLRTRLVNVAGRVIASEGLKLVHARRIAAAAGCSTGTLYNIFGGLDGLILAVNSRTLDDLNSRLTETAAAAAGHTISIRLMALFGTTLDFAAANHLCWRALFEHRVPKDHALPDGYADGRRHLQALLETEFQAAIPEPVALAEAAFALASAVHGIVLLSLDAQLGPFDSERSERQIEFLVSHVVRGLG